MYFTTPDVVGDEQVGELVPLLKVAEQIEDLRLHRDVEGRDRLVGDDQRRLHRQCPSDPHPLPLPSRQLVGKALCVGRLETDVAQQVGDAIGDLAAGDRPMDEKRLREDPSHPHPRRQ